MALLLCSGIGIVLYANSVAVPFYLDDYRNILENPFTRLNNFTFKTFFRALADSPVSSRPVANFSFALNYRLHQQDVFGYHVVNINRCIS